MVRVIELDFDSVELIKLDYFLNARSFDYSFSGDVFLLSLLLHVKLLILLELFKVILQSVVIGR